jgi:hypothetical protein
MRASEGKDMPPVLQKEKPRPLQVIGVWNKSLTVTYSRMPKGTLPSAQSVFTSEFGKGSGGSHSLMPSGKKGSGEFCFDACRVRAVMQKISLASTIKQKLLEVIWSSLTGN